MDRFDLVIIGAGPGGYRAAVLAALRGMRVAIVERGAWGGCCLNRGCVPKKDWYEVACLLATRAGLPARGAGGALSGDLAAAWRHQRQVVAAVQASYLDYCARLGVRVVAGEARIAPDGRVVVAGAGGVTGLAGDAVVLAVGAKPNLPPGMALQSDRILTTDRLFEAPPPAGRRVAILGGGAIAIEFAFILRAFGCDVLWLAREAPLARSRFSSTARAALLDALAAVDVRPQIVTALPRLKTVADGVVVEHASGADPVDWVLLALGRAPATGGLDLDHSGVALTGEGLVSVDPYLETSRPGIYAIGDCAGGPMTANQALADAALIVDNLSNPGARQRRDPDRIPVALYSAIELARVGLNEDDAERAGLEPAVGFAAFATSPAALAQDDGRGFVRLIADLDNARLLGGEVVGRGAGELIHLLSLGAPEDALARFAGGGFNHPARAEELQNAAETLAAKWGLGH